MTAARALLAVVAVASCAACSSPEAPAPAPRSGSSASGGSGGAAGGQASEDPPIVRNDTTWENGKHITSPVVIDAGATVTIAPGALVTCDDGITITVRGTLRVAAGGATHAKISGAAWNGIVVASGGTLAADGLDLDNAHVGIEVQTGAAAATYDRGTIAGSTAPFLVDEKASLTTSHAVVAASLGTSHVFGSLKASYIDYDANGFDGFRTENDDATLSIEDSTLHGGGGTSDMITAYTGGASVHVAYTTITKVHCAFHFERVASYDVDHVTAEGDAYGFMMYGSLATGTRTVTASNFVGNYVWGFDERDDTINGPITIRGCYFQGNGSGDVHLHAASSVSVVEPAAARIAGAAPR